MVQPGFRLPITEPPAISPVQHAELGANRRFRAEGHGYIEVPSDLHTVETRRRHSGYFEGMLLNGDLASDDKFVATVLTLPEGVADDYSGRGTLGAVILRRK